METAEKIEVFHDGKRVGTLAHATTIAGEGLTPSLDDILAVVQKAGIDISRARKTAEKVRETVNSMLSEYLSKENLRL